MGEDRRDSSDVDQLRHFEVWDLGQHPAYLMFRIIVMTW